jgi:hypothetical protein
MSDRGVCNPHSANHAKILRTYAAARVGATICFDIATLGADPTFDTIEGVMTERGAGYVVVIDGREELPWAQPGFLYRNWRSVTGRAATPPPPTQAENDEAILAALNTADDAVAAAGNASAIAEGAASAAADATASVTSLAAQLRRLEAASVASFGALRREDQAQAERQQQFQQQLKDELKDHLLKLQAQQQRQMADFAGEIRREVSTLRATSTASLSASASAPSIRSASPVPAAPLVLGTPAAPAAAPKSFVLGPAPASVSTGSTLADDVALNALRMMGDQARRDKPWKSSHELVPDDGFTPTEIAALLTVPAYGWPKDDENSAKLLRAVRGIARHLLRHATTPVPDVIEKLRLELLTVRKTLGPTWISSLQLLLLVPEAAQMTRVVLAELSLTADSDAPDDLVPRLALARTMTRTDKTEAAAILAAKQKTSSAVGDLPLQLRERISRWA